MYKVVTKRFLNDAKSICLFEIEAPLVARHAQAGQFVIFRLDEQGERVPVSVAGYDREKGTVTVMVQAAGKTTRMLHTVEEGDYISDFVGPLGKATEMEGLKKVCVVGGGTGNALAYPLACGMHDHGIHVDMIAGFKSKAQVILEDEFKAGVDRVFITTDDGSYGEKGFTTDKLKELIEAGNEYDEIVAVGPPMMMKFTCKIAEDYGIHSIASLTAYMIDGTGMCGGCRCIVGGENKFVCVDGPEFDGALVDWDELIKRSAYYSEQEAEDRAHVCRLTGGVRYND